MTTKSLLLIFTFFFSSNVFGQQMLRPEISEQQEKIDELIVLANSSLLTTSLYENALHELNAILIENPGCNGLFFWDEHIECAEDLQNRLQNWMYITTFLWFARFQDYTSDQLETRIRKEISCNFFEEPLSTEQNKFLKKWFIDYDKSGNSIVTYRKLNCND